MTATKPRPSAGTVMDRLADCAPHLAENCYMDREWVWYCGPSLQGKPADRQVLKDLGFRFSPDGHMMPDGETLGSWGHSCQRSMFPKRRDGSKPRWSATLPDEAFVELGL